MTPYEKVLREVSDLRASQEKVRKGQFAKIGSNTKEITNLKERLEILERGICQSDIEERFRTLLSEYADLKKQMDDMHHDFMQLKGAFLPLASIFERKYDSVEPGVKTL